jgi:colanic acid/amylovoran biosynthesis glycosyltransferase
VLLENGKFDVIHCHFGVTGRFIAEIIAHISCNIFITSFYGMDITVKSQIKNRPFCSLIRNGDAFLSLCNSMTDRLVSLGFPEERIIVHPVGLHLWKYERSRQKRNGKGPYNILTVARLIEKKGIHFSLEALSKIIHETDFHITYRIIGDGPLKEDLMKSSFELGIQNHVEFLGWKTQDETIEYLKTADLFVLPSVTAEDGDQEGTPTILLEAQAMGVPVISTYHSGIPEVVDDGRSGFLVPEKNSGAIFDRILYLLNNVDSWQVLGAHGRKFVERRFDARRLNKRLVGIYEDLLSKKS